MLISLSETEVKVLYDILKNNYNSLDETHNNLFQKVSEIKNIIEDPCRNICKSFGKKKLGDKYIDAEKTCAYLGSGDLNKFISSEWGTNEVMLIDDQFVISGVQEMYDGDHRYFNLLVEGQ